VIYSARLVDDVYDNSSERFRFVRRCDEVDDDVAATVYDGRRRRQTGDRPNHGGAGGGVRSARVDRVALLARRDAADLRTVVSVGILPAAAAAAASGVAVRAPAAAALRATLPAAATPAARQRIRASQHGRIAVARGITAAAAPAATTAGSDFRRVQNDQDPRRPGSPIRL